MNKAFSLSVLTSAILLAGCGDNSERSGASTDQGYSDAINALLARDSSINFNLLGGDADVPLPSFLLSDTSDGTLNIPLGFGDDPNDLSNPLVALGETDGWSTSQPFSINTHLEDGVTLLNDVTIQNGVPFSVHLNQGVLVAKVTFDPTTGIMSNFTPLTAGVDYLVASPDLKTINVLPLKGLDSNSDYIYALTDTIVDSNQAPLGISKSYATLKSTQFDQSGSLETPQKVIRQIEALFAANSSVSSDNIIYSSWFTTASAGTAMAGTKAAMSLLAAPNVTPAMVWKGSANPNDLSENLLNSLYQINVDAGQDFATAVTNDPYFNGVFGAQVAQSLATAYGANFDNPAVAEIQVHRGTVTLPYFLSDSLDNNQWQSTPWRSGMPSIAKIIDTLTNGSDADKVLLTKALLDLGIDDPAVQLQDPSQQAKLIGAEFILSNGQPLDSDRVMTKYSAVPQIRAVKEVPFILFLPKGAAIGADLPIVQYQHGITSLKETAYGFAIQHIGGALQSGASPYAIVAIDQPLHGQRGLSADVVTTPDNPTVYMNLTYLPVARDNIRQSAIDGLGVRFALGSSNVAELSGLDTSNVSLFGHSIGAITGISSVAIGNTPLNPAIDGLFSYNSAVLANPGGGIAPFLLNSGTFGPTIKHSIAATSVPEYTNYYLDTCLPIDTAGGVCFEEFYATLDNNDPTEAVIKATIDGTLTQFTFAAQTVLDSVDPFNIAAQVNGPVLGFQADGDSTIPNSVAAYPTAGTEPLFAKLQLVNTANSTQGSRLASYFNAASNAQHSTALLSQSGDDSAANAEMTSQIVQFVLSGGNQGDALVVTPALLDSSK